MRYLMVCLLALAACASQNVTDMGAGRHSVTGTSTRGLPAARADSELIRRNLADVLLAQGYQDLTGQIIRSVMKLVEELETALANLAKNIHAF